MDEESNMNNKKRREKPKWWIEERRWASAPNNSEETAMDSVVQRFNIILGSVKKNLEIRIIHERDYRYIIHQHFSTRRPFSLLSLHQSTQNAFFKISAHADYSLSAPQIQFGVVEGLGICEGELMNYNNKTHGR